jgi:hypothetical protein
LGVPGMLQPPKWIYAGPSLTRYRPVCIVYETDRSVAKGQEGKWLLNLICQDMVG